MLPRKTTVCLRNLCYHHYAEHSDIGLLILDPLALPTPVLIRAKIFIEHLRELHCDWDAPLAQKLINDWNDIETEVLQASGVVIRHPYTLIRASSTVKLHTFSDTSTKAYGAVVYIKHGKEISVVISKSRVKPLKDITLPRLEQLEAVVATYLTQLVKWALSDVIISSSSLG